MKQEVPISDRQFHNYRKTESRAKESFVYQTSETTNSQYDWEIHFQVVRWVEVECEEIEEIQLGTYHCTRMYTPWIWNWTMKLQEDTTSATKLAFTLE